jgi:hypothetical protein
VGLKFIVIISLEEAMSDSMQIAKQAFTEELAFREDEIISITL